MSDNHIGVEPLRTDPSDSGPLSEAERAARIEQLLLSGLDHYFGGNYEQAINVWTRVAFLERGHGRARAYIERARSALAERQRESEESLHQGIAAYQAGDLQRARVLLTQAVEQGGANELALVFLQRLGRLDSVPPSSQRERPANRPAPTRRHSDTAGDSEESLAGNSRRQRRHHGNHPPRCSPHGVVVARVSSRGSRWRFGVARAASDRARCRAPHRSRSGAPR